MRADFTLPRDYPRVQAVDTFAALANTPLCDGVNALVLPRTLDADFESVVHALCASREGIHEGITPLDEERLLALSLPARARRAVEIMVQDLHLLRDAGLCPELNCIRAYPREDSPGPVPLDVYSYHADSAPIETDTWLCTYFGAPSEGLRNDQALRCSDEPTTREALLKAYGGPDDAAFQEYLRHECFDLHYQALPHAEPFSFGLGNLWRIATEWPGNPVPPCVHRAPENVPGQPPRLLLIS